MTDTPSLPPERVMMRLEHLMSEISRPSHEQDGVPEGTWGERSVTSIRSPHRRFAVIAGVAASVLVGTAVGSIAIAGSPGLGSPAFAVTPAGEDSRINILDTSAAAEQMTRQLSAKGLDVTVRTAAVNEQLVGTWVSVGSDGTTSEAVLSDLTEQALGYSDDIVVPRGADGLVLTVGVAPEAGEEPSVIGLRNGFAPGGPLECSPARGAQLDDATALLVDKGFSVRTVDFATLDPTAVAGSAIVTSVFHTDDAPDQLMVVALDPTDPRLDAQMNHGFSPHQAADPGCPRT